MCENDFDKNEKHENLEHTYESMSLACSQSGSFCGGGERE